MGGAAQSPQYPPPSPGRHQAHSGLPRLPPPRHLQLVGFPGSFKKVAAVRANLQALVERREQLPAKRSLTTDPNGFLSWDDQ